MAGEHEVVFDQPAADDVLQGLLDAEAARVGFLAGGEIVMVLPVGKAAMA